MSRKKLIRRFEPRYTVNQEMVDREAAYVAREHQDYLLGSLDDLRKRSEKIRVAWRQASEAAESLIALQGEREALAYRCMIGRDLYHILELYNTCMRAGSPPTSVEGVKPPETLPISPANAEGKFAPFPEWLFEGES